MGYEICIVLDLRGFVLFSEKEASKRPLTPSSCPVDPAIKRLRRE